MSERMSAEDLERALLEIGAALALCDNSPARGRGSEARRAIKRHISALESALEDAQRTTLPRDVYLVWNAETADIEAIFSTHLRASEYRAARPHLRHLQIHVWEIDDNEVC